MPALLKRVVLYSVKSLSYPALVVRINAWKVYLSRVPSFPTYSTATIVWRVSVAKDLSVHVCRFGIEGSCIVGPGTSFSQIFKRKLLSPIT